MTYQVSMEDLSNLRTAAVQDVQRAKVVGSTPEMYAATAQFGRIECCVAVCERLEKLISLFTYSSPENGELEDLT